MNSSNIQRLCRIQNFLNAALPENINDLKLENFFTGIPCGVSKKHAEELQAPCSDLIRRGGKRWRPLLLVLACELAGGSEESAYPLTPVPEFIHTASLIHDDIEDGGCVRRGDSAIHLKYGLDTALNAGSWLYFHALNTVNNSEYAPSLKYRLHKICEDNLIRLHLGQAMDISWHKRLEFFPSREEYAAMVRLKTGSLARLAGELGFAAAERTKEEAEYFGNLAAELGAGFQILDDVKNLDKGNAGKLRGDDIVEGKKSFPVILFAEKEGGGGKKISCLFAKAKKEGIGSQAVEESISLMKDSGVLDEARSTAMQMISGTCKKIDEMYSANGHTENLKDLFLSLTGE